MLEYNGKEFRNLEDQVGYLTEAFKSGKLIDELGIKVLGVFPDLTTAKETIRPPYEYGDAFEIGTTKPYDLYIYTRNVEDFFDFGPFPAPGPKGDLGPSPSISINANVTNTTGTPEATVTKTGTDEAPTFNFTFKNIKGERGQTGMQGIQGPRGFQGPTGPIGPRGYTGPKGDVGPAFKLLGDLTSTSQLPSPTAALQAQGAAYTIPNAQGVKHIWVIQGTDNLLWVDLGESGVQGPKGDDGIGINNLRTIKDIGAPSITYNTTDGITIQGTERYTYITAGSGAQVDVNTEKKIPLIAGEGISIDATNEADKAVIKSLSSNIKNGTGTGSLVQKTVSSSGTPYANEASGSGSVALGKKVKSKGNTTFVIGQENEAIADTSASFTSGRLNANRGSYNITGGENNANNNSWNLVIGKGNSVSDGRFGIVSGLNNVYTGPGDYKNTSVSILGNNLYAQYYQPSDGALLIGRYNEVEGTSGRLFVIGNGTSKDDRKNAFEVLEDGRIRVPNFDAGGNRIGMVTLKVVNGALQVTTYV